MKGKNSALAAFLGKGWHSGERHYIKRRGNSGV